MIKFIFLVVSIFISFNCFAKSCYISDDTLAEFSKKYESLVQLEVTNHDEMLFISFNAPLVLKGKRLNSAILFKEKTDESYINYSIPLSFQTKLDKAMAWFSIDKRTVMNSSLKLDYGEECGIAISYMLPK